MSDDNKNSESLEDFDFNSLNTDEAQENVGETVFDLDNPFGDDIVVSKNKGDTGGFPESAGEVLSDFGDSFGGDLTSEGNVSEDNPFFGDSAAEGEASVDVSTDADTVGEKGKPKKKGLLGGLFGGKGKKKAPKKSTAGEGSEDAGDDAGESEGSEKKKKVAKEKKSASERTPVDFGGTICIVFSALWLACLLVFNIVALLYAQEAGISLMQILTFMGAINIVGLAALSVPVLFYKFPQGRTLPNVMLGIAAVAIFIGVQVAITEFYRYGFMVVA